MTRDRCLPFHGLTVRHRRTGEVVHVTVEDDGVTLGPVYLRGWKDGQVVRTHWNWGFDIAAEWLAEADEVRPDGGGTGG